MGIETNTDVDVWGSWADPNVRSTGSWSQLGDAEQHLVIKRALGSAEDKRGLGHAAASGPRIERACGAEPTLMLVSPVAAVGPAVKPRAIGTANAMAIIVCEVSV